MAVSRTQYKKYCPAIPVGLRGISDGLVTSFQKVFVNGQSQASPTNDILPLDHLSILI